MGVRVVAGGEAVDGWVEARAEGVKVAATVVRASTVVKAVAVERAAATAAAAAAWVIVAKAAGAATERAAAEERVTVWVSRSNRHYSTFQDSSSTLETGDSPSPHSWHSSCSLRTSHIAHNGGGGRGSTTAERSKTALSTKKLVNV